MVYNTATVGSLTPGFYYWNGTAWTGIATGSGASTIQFGVQDNTTYNGGDGFGVLPTFPTVDNNIAGGWNASPASFIVPAAGWYNFKTFATGKANNGVGSFNNASLGVHVELSTDGGTTWNGLAADNFVFHGGNTVSIGTDYAGQLNAGDRVRARVQFCAGCGVTSYSLLKASFLGVRLF
jgi:hypothetical protein